ncbi:flippase [Methanobrevibacter olleyae]|uniref:Polysaccharide biosynthesis protein n=1 Tax=Methanobrevibacter olleyae TaxID=294671 RepID=A0A126R0H1_METOL|nr:flippase [Methanobrevibacter olleyae]AMK15870.1 polysaccharide biosynthesis protein [Methanobrevibacter olleyae]SFL21059.1 stage V sporulation protein B [Methanobrevibacter olleyae]
MTSKIVKNSVIILIGNIIFRIGGYIYHYLMAILLGASNYGILTLTLPFQGIFQILSAGGLPPAIAKYISEYNTLNKEDYARQTVFTSLKIMIILGILFGFIMVFFVAPWLAYTIYNKPIALLPLQAIGLITPFSVIVGGFRGAFQGVYKMEYILYTRAVEQIIMILSATALVLIGLSTFGAVLGSVLGFLFSALSAIYIFKRYMGKYLPEPSENFKFSLKDELKLAKKLISFSIPVSITALAEMGIYSICTMIIGVFLTSTVAGYFGAANPIARLPLIMSGSIATTILPAASEAFATKNKLLLQKYVDDAYKYGMFFIIPMCVGIAVFSKEILGLLYFKNPAYINGYMALSILVVGMTFYSIYTISSSITQGIGNPKISMYILIIGSILTFILGWLLIPIYGIEGAALATTISSFLMMIPMFLIQFRLTKTNPPYKFLLKVTIASLIMVIPSFILPNNPIRLIIGLIICPIIYIILIILLKTLSHRDIEKFKELSKKLGPLKKYCHTLLNTIDKYCEE